MVRGLYTSGMGMIASMMRMDVITNNMANVNTTAYKRDHVVSHEFSDIFLFRLNDPKLRMFFNHAPVMGTVNPGVFVDDVFTVFEQGPLAETGNPLDIAILGQGFFVVNLDGEEIFTRDGAFTLAPNGLLMTGSGGRVQGLNGDIILPNGYIVIDDNGRVFVNSEYVDTLQLTTFTDLHSLRKMEDNFFRTTELSVREAFAGSVTQGFLEQANVNIVREMVEMITLQRAYDTNARVVSMIDQTLQQAVNDIARRQ